jgi:hypothetical protein
MALKDDDMIEENNVEKLEIAEASCFLNCLVLC